MKKITTLIFSFILLTSIQSLPLNYSNAASMSKVKIPIDPRPLPQTAAHWEKVKKIPDPLKEDPIQSISISLASTNISIPWYKLNWGDLILGRGASKNAIPYGYFRHVGMWHHDKKLILSAMPKQGVVLENLMIWNKEYPRLELMKVTKLNHSEKKSITLYGAKQLGKPYKISSKSTARSWYCSKIPWACYKGKGIDLDSYGAYVVTPDSLYYSPHTQSLFSRTM